MTNRTFGIIKPDAVSGGKTGAIIQRILDNGFRIRGLKLIHMSRKEAEGFYAVHRERPFFAGLTEFMSSAPCVVMTLEKEGAVKAWRDLMGATDPAKADEGTLRKNSVVPLAKMQYTAPIQTKMPLSKSHISLAS